MFTRFVSCLVALLLAVSLTGCGKKPAPKPEKTGKVEKSEEKKSEEPKSETKKSEDSEKPALPKNPFDEDS